MKRLAFLLLIVATAFAQPELINVVLRLPVIGYYPIASLPTTGLKVGAIAVAIDANVAGSCTVAGGIALSLCRWSGTAWASLGGGGGGGGTPGGLDTTIQFNSGGAFAGDAGLTYNLGTQTTTAVNLGVTTSANLPWGTYFSGYVDMLAQTAPATPAAGKGRPYVDSTSKNLAIKDDAGVVKHGVQTKAAVANSFAMAIDDAGVVTVRQPTPADLALGTLATAMTVGTGGSVAPTSPTVGAVSANQINGVSLAGLATGLMKITLGIPSIAVAADWPGGVTNGDTHDHVGGDGAPIAEPALSLTDTITWNASLAAHGFMPKLTGNTAQYMSGGGSWMTLTGGGNVTGPVAGTGGELTTVSAGGTVLTRSALTGVLKATAGVPAAVTGTATDCVRVNGTSGACSGGVTAASDLTDFLVTLSTTSVTDDTVNIAAGHARVGNYSPTHIALGKIVVTGGSGDVKLFIDSANNLVCYKETAGAIATTVTGSVTCSNASTPAYPANSIPLWDLAVSAAQAVSIDADDRAFLATRGVSAGTGISISDSGGVASMGIDTATVPQLGAGSNDFTGAISALELRLLSGSEGTCSSSTRGRMVMVFGGSGAADTVRICSKDAAGAYAWRTLL
jgi:hypothetical protein